MTFEDYIQQIRDIGKKARERDVSAPFTAASNQMALGRTSELEALNRQQIEAEQQAMAQQQDRGFETLGGSPAAEKRFNEAVAAGGQRYNLAASQLGIQQGQAEMAQAERADASDRLAAQAGAQYESQLVFQRNAANLQREMKEVQRRENELNRQHAQALNAANNATQYAQIAANATAAANSLAVQKARIRAEIQMNQVRFGGGGGVRMTANFSSGASNFQDHLKSMGVMR